MKTRPAEQLDLWVKETDASRHSKWLSFMEVRLELAKKLLKESGVIAVHIGYQELFRLGLLMDEVFGEDNRLGIINWQCTGSAKNDSRGIASTTDYVLIYAKNKNTAHIGELPRTEKMDSAYRSLDGDPRIWRQDNLSAMSGTESYFYGIENSLTGDMHFPPNGRYWSMPKEKVKNILLGWGVEYKIDSQGNCVVKKGENRNKARDKFKNGPWPIIYFSKKDGTGRPLIKRYRDTCVNEGITPQTFWPFDDILDNTQNSNASIGLAHEISGTNRGAKKLIKDILGNEIVFDTPKPLKLTERLIELFCPKDGTVLDAFAGSATTAHAVLSLNAKDKESNRKFIIIERGSSNYGYADSITAERVRRVIDGNWATPAKDTTPTGGSFVYLKAGKPISGKYILESKRDDLVDIILTSHEGSVALDDEESKKIKHVIGKDINNNAIALVWDPDKGAERGHLTMKIHKEILEEVKALKLNKPVFIYASVNAGPNGSPSYMFRQIPDEILAALEITNLVD